MTTSQPCPCGSTILFPTCCGVVIQDHGKAVTAEQLMRSRYSAFVIKDSKHILASWYITNRPKSLNFDDHPVVWLELEIHNTVDGEENDTTGQVEFTSKYLENGLFCSLREISDFVKENGLWYYKSGECTVHREQLARNSPCPCGSGKKFKRCCLNKQ